MKPKLVILESNFCSTDIGAKLAYAVECVKDSMNRGEAPLASYLCYRQEGMIDHTWPPSVERADNAAHAWIPASEYTVAYIDHGIYGSMQSGIFAAHAAGKKVEYRKLYPKPHVCLNAFGDDK